MNKSKSKSFALLGLLLFSACTPETETNTNKPEETETETTAPHTQQDENSAPTEVAEQTTEETPTAEAFKLRCEEARFVTMLNLYRKAHQLSTVVVSQKGVISARWHALDMITNNYFSHTEPNGRTFSERALSFGYPAWAENIAAGNVTANSTFCQWKNSPGHNTNMLRPLHVSIGIGNMTGNGMYRSYWSNNFGPATNDTVLEPLTLDVNCPMPTTLPSC